LRLPVGCDKANLSGSRRIAAVLLVGRRRAHREPIIIRDLDPLGTCTLPASVSWLVLGAEFGF
jgi:hypothetical protein